MTTSALPFAPCSWSDVAYDCDGRGRLGLAFRLRLSFLDETRDPPVAGSFHHEWVVSRGDLDLAERSGNIDSLLLDRRAREARAFIGVVERSLRQARARLARAGERLVLVPRKD